MSTEAWLLHKMPSGDTSARLSLLTREMGLVSCLYKGGRVSRKHAVLQPFIPLWLALDRKKDWAFVQSLENLSPPLALKGTALFAALYINELVYHSLKPEDPHPALYEAYQYTLNALADVSNQVVMEFLLRSFEWVLLRECGFALSILDGHDGFQQYRLVAGGGFVASDSGWPHNHICAIIQGDFSNVAVLKTAKRVMRQAVDHLLDNRELKSRQFFKRLSMP